MKILILFLSGVIFLTGKKYDKKEEQKRHDRKLEKAFSDKYLLSKWERYLYMRCGQIKIWPKKEAFLWFRAVAQVESRCKDYAKEWRGRHVISRGRFQISKATYDLYRYYHGLKKGNFIKDAHDPYINTDVFLWSMKLYYKKFKDFKLALSAHNLGLTGFYKWRRRTKKKYYFWYVDKVDKRRGKSEEKING